MLRRWSCYAVTEPRVPIAVEFLQRRDVTNELSTVTKMIASWDDRALYAGTVGFNLLENPDALKGSNSRIRGCFVGRASGEKKYAIEDFS